MTPAKSSFWFTRFAKATARAAGQPAAFAMAAFIIVAMGLLSSPGRASLVMIWQKVAFDPCQGDAPPVQKEYPVGPLRAHL